MERDGDGSGGVAGAALVAASRSVQKGTCAGSWEQQPGLRSRRRCLRGTVGT